jgi:hypothetical protein
MHHLARHSVACFLTRGDLYVSWEEGKAVFEELLIDQVGDVAKGCASGCVLLRPVFPASSACSMFVVVRQF